MLLQNWAAVCRARVLVIPLAAAVTPAITGMTVAQHCVEGVPQDARVERVLLLAPDTFGVVFSHADWKLINMGGIVPLIEVQIEPLNIMQMPPGGMPPIDGALADAPAPAEVAPTDAPIPVSLPDDAPPLPEPVPFRRRPSPILLPGG